MIIADDFEFLHMLAKLRKAFDYAGIKVIQLGGSAGGGIFAHIEHDKREFGFFIMETTNIENAMKEFLCDPPEKTN